MTDILTLKNISAFYGTLQSLYNVSLQFKKNRISCLLGSNGAGKSTLLKAIMGQVRTKGTLSLNDIEIQNVVTHERVKQGLSLIPEGRGIFPHLSVKENLQLGAYLKNDLKSGLLENHPDFDFIMTCFPKLKERFKQQAGTLSGGEQQMLAIARGLLHSPQVLLLDEPSLGLAPQMIMAIFTALQEINARGVTVILVEQNAMLALQISHDAFLIESGHLTQQGLASEFLNSDQIKRAYLGFSA